MNSWEALVVPGMVVGEQLPYVLILTKIPEKLLSVLRQRNYEKTIDKINTMPRNSLTVGEKKLRKTK